jgi:hypothetical protein
MTTCFEPLVELERVPACTLSFDRSGFRKIQP